MNCRFSAEDVTKAMTEVCLNILEDDIQLREDAYKAMEVIMKDAGAFPTEIREYLDGALPPEPPRPPSPRLVAELERLKAEDEAREEEHLIGAPLEPCPRPHHRRDQHGQRQAPRRGRRKAA